MNTNVRVSEFMSNSGSLSKMFDGLTRIVAYPQNDVREIARIMMDIKIDRMPVLFSPWNKKLVGFIELNKISAFLND